MGGGGSAGSHDQHKRIRKESTHSGSLPQTQARDGPYLFDTCVAVLPVNTALKPVGRELVAGSKVAVSEADSPERLLGKVRDDGVLQVRPALVSRGNDTGHSAAVAATFAGRGPQNRRRPGHGIGRQAGARRRGNRGSQISGVHAVWGRGRGGAGMVAWWRGGERGVAGWRRTRRGSARLCAAPQQRTDEAQSPKRQSRKCEAGQSPAVEGPGKRGWTSSFAPP